MSCFHVFPQLQCNLSRISHHSKYYFDNSSIFSLELFQIFSPKCYSQINYIKESESNGINPAHRSDIRDKGGMENSAEVPELFMEMSNLSGEVQTLTGVLRLFTYKTQMSQPLIPHRPIVLLGSPVRKWWIDGRMWEKMLWMPQCLSETKRLEKLFKHFKTAVGCSDAKLDCLGLISLQLTNWIYSL